MMTASATPPDNDFDVSTLRGITADSRMVKGGFLFAAFCGANTNGTAYITDAIQNGAAAILVHTDADIKDMVIPRGVTVVRDENPRRRFAHIAAQIYGHIQPDHIAAITGTNGKTSTAHFVRELWRMMGRNAASIGTLGILYGEHITPQSASMTSPTADVFHKTLSDMARASVSHLVIEASSHGLHQYRLDGARITTAAFTNLSHDHLDYHDNMSDYLQAKLRLFTEVLMPDGMVILNADIDDFNTIKSACSPMQKIITYGAATGCDIQLLARTPTAQGQDVRVRVFGHEHDVHIPLIGDFQTMNILCAIGIVAAQNRDLILKIIEHIPNLTNVAGRLEYIGGHPRGAGVYVDYAHTPDALKSALNAVRPHTQNRLVCLFGCGGDRDAKKRLIMGQIAADLADVVYVTDDNPRSENADDIRAAITAGVPNAINIEGRAAAIKAAINALNEGDCLIIAGKGHEQGQIIGDAVTPFDDRIHARNVIAALVGSTTQEGGHHV